MNKEKTSFLVIVGGISLLVIGNSPATLLPFTVGSLEEGFNLSKQSIGLVVSIELIAMAISAIFFGSFVSKLNLKKSALFGCLLVVVGYFLCSLTDSIEFLRIIRGVSGIGSGLLIACGHNVLSASVNPERSYAAFILVTSLCGASFVWIAGIAAEEGGYSLMFMIFGFITLLLAPLLFFAKKQTLLIEELDVNNSVSVTSPIVILMTLGLLFFSLPSGGMWAFNERLGVEIGLLQSVIGKILSFSLLVGLLAPILVWFVGDRFGRKKPILVCLVLILFSFIYMLTSMHSIAYITGNLIWNFTYTVTVIFVLAAAAHLSPDGKLASWMNATALISQASSPVVFGWILGTQSFNNLLPYIIASILISMFCVLLTRNQLDEGY